MVSLVKNLGDVDDLGIGKMQLHYHIVHKGNMHFWGKLRKFQRQRNYHLGGKLL